MNENKCSWTELIIRICQAIVAGAISSVIIANTLYNIAQNRKEAYMPIDANAALPVIGSIVDTTTGGLFNIGAAKRNRKFAREMYGRQRADALADWNMTNEYNSPAAQMKRLQEAGINPFTVYGDGGSIVQSATARSSDMTMGNEQPMNGTRLGEALRDVYNVKLANAQLTTQKLQQELLRQQAAKTTAETSKTLNEAGISKWQLDRNNELSLQYIEDAWAGTGLKKAQIDATVHGNQRANELQPYQVKMAGKLNSEKDLEIAGKKLDNAMKAMQNGQYDAMRPLELARAKNEIEHQLAQIKNTKQDTKNKFQVTRLNKMEADLGKVLQYIRSVAGGAANFIPKQ